MVSIVNTGNYYTLYPFYICLEKQISNRRTQSYNSKVVYSRSRVVGPTESREHYAAFKGERASEAVQPEIDGQDVSQTGGQHKTCLVCPGNRQGLWWLVIGDEPAQKLVDKAMMQAQVTFQSAARDPGLVGQARRRTERALRAAFEAVGWKVQLAWLGGRS